MMSIRYFELAYGATGVLLEMEIEYWIDFKMVDFVCKIDGTRVGVSVTRAMGYPTPDRFTPEKAADLVNKKLYGLVVARDSVVKKHRFFKSVLHIWCQTDEISAIVKDAYDNMDDEMNIKGDMLLILTTYANPEIYHLDKNDWKLGLRRK